uniref:Uncharacterized protein LOC104247017 n=1 Tax=Nicotiana sylvestris TaxID=4096 RepID=A0A1U7YAV2_NICSY|nr:PREDICTED: uncharacterized protein LOC104247017 [Nicotiana sylvestris]
MMRSSSPPHSGGGSGACSVGGGGLNYIEHQVSKFDTLPGVAIKYGVEVADIKRLNGLVSDLQMFALKTLQIPLHGRHPPSPVVSNGQDAHGPSSSEKTPSSNRYPDLFGSFQSLKLKSSSQPRVSHYGGPKPEIQKLASEGFEMAVYRKGVSHYLEDGPFFKSTPHSNPPLSLHRKCKSVANDMSENGVLGNHLSQDSTENGSDRWFEKFSRSGSGFSAVAGKDLALRPKSASRTLSGPDTEASSINPIPMALNDSLLNESTSVRKSSSTSSLQDSDSSGTLSSLWTTTKWNLKPDFQAISAAAITKPIFDSLPKPITARKSKTAVD